MSLSAAFIIRCHYAPDDPRFTWRLKLFTKLTLPSIHKQTDQDFDICVRCNPAHDEIFRQLGCKPFHVKNEYADYFADLKGKRPKVYFYDFVKWEDVVGLKQYDIQMSLDSDDRIAPDYVAIVKKHCRASKTSLHIHFQPERWHYNTRKVRRNRFRYSDQHGSMFFVLYYPDKSHYHYVGEYSHRYKYRLTERTILIPAGHCWLTIHGQNESSGREFSEAEIKKHKTYTAGYKEGVDWTTYRGEKVGRP